MSVSLKDVSHQYGSEAMVLDNVSIAIHDGEMVAFVGPSGSGKTTLLAVLGLLMRPSAGYVNYDKRPVAPRGPGRTNMLARTAWVFQTTNLLPRRSVLANTMMGPLSTGTDRSAAKRSAFAALKLVNLESMATIRVGLLSGGEAQRVGVARALARSPQFMFADEPTGQLDADATALVISALSDRRERGQTTVIATHDMTVAEACDRIIRISSGKLEEAE